MTRKNLELTIKILIIICFSILILLSSLFICFYNKNFYKGEFAKYGVDLKYANVNDYNNQVLDYLQGKKESMPATIELNSRELTHMQDVRGVFSFFAYLAYVIGFLFVVFSILSYYILRKRILKIIPSILLFSGIASIVFSILLIIFFYFGFDSSFTMFHRIFFTGNSWIFLATDNIVNIYPEGLFFDLALRIFVVYLSISIIVAGIGVWFRQKI